jgi:hypothetical protein
MNVVIITSVSRVSPTSFSYCSNRSVYTYKERIEQLKATIQSAYTIPSAYVILAECSNLDEEDENSLAKLVDMYLNMKDTWVQEAVDSQYKGWGEGAILTYTISKILDLATQNQPSYLAPEAASDKNVEHPMKINSVYKLSGRYVVDYVPALFDNDRMVAKKLNNDENNVSVVFYKIPFDKIAEYQKFLIDNVESLKNGIEPTFAQFAKQMNAVYVDNIGYSGNVSVCGSFASG